MRLFQTERLGLNQGLPQDCRESVPKKGFAVSMQTKYIQHFKLTDSKSELNLNLLMELTFAAWQSCSSGYIYYSTVSINSRHHSTILYFCILFCDFCIFV